MRILLSLIAFAVAAPALAQPMDDSPNHFTRDRLRKASNRRKRDPEKPAFEFTAPEGWSVTPRAEDDDDPPALAATSKTGGTMTARIDNGTVTIDDALIADAVKKITDAFVAAHATGTAKVLKKDLVKLDGGAAVHVVVEMRADKKKATKPVREVHYIIGNATHHAHVVYAAPAAGFAKLEAVFDASLRKTVGLAAPAQATVPSPAPAPAKK